jgi:hypothetical protein
MADHTIYVKFGSTGGVAEPNKNPSPSQSPEVADKGSITGDLIKFEYLKNAGKQVMNSTISNIGFVTGNYELQEQAELLVSGVGLAVGLFAAPIPVAIGLSIKTGFDVYTLGVKQSRAAYQQQQNQVLTGKISVNGGRY